MNNFLEYFVIGKISNLTSFIFKVQYFRPIQDIINTQQNIIPAAIIIIIINLSSILLIIYGFAGFLLNQLAMFGRVSFLDNYTTI